MKNIIVANWKLNPTTKKEAEELFLAVSNGAKSEAEVVVCPPFIYLSFLTAKTNVKLGGQNCFWEQKGAYTGEISSEMLKDLNCEYVIIGHSERRRYFEESDEIVNKKLKAAIGAGLKTIFCIGETESQRENDETDAIIAQQIIGGLSEISEEEFKNGIIAYEPVWAIGTGNACDTDEAGRMATLIRAVVSKIYNKKFAEDLSILYGGSVNSQNAESYIKNAKMNGLLVGGASLKAQEFVEIIAKSV